MTTSDNNFDIFLNAYIECALFASSDESDECGGEPLDKNYGPQDLAPEALERMQNDCRAFLDRCEVIEGDMEQAGHDFWLTRNGHGCGFWDGDWEEPWATKYTKISKVFGECWLYVGDDGVIYHA